MRFITVILGLLVAALLSGMCQAAAIKGTIVIAHQDVPVNSLSSSAVKDVFTAKTTYWDGGQRIIIALIDSATDDALKEISGMSASQFRIFWQRLTFSGRGQQPKKAASAAALVWLVASTKGAIALVPAGTHLDGVKPLHIE
jgi:ABC-type phosphate transport system substrate-binding protein